LGSHIETGLFEYVNWLQLAKDVDSGCLLRIS